MPTIHAFIGPAGSGKTYKLNAQLNKLCSNKDFKEYQSVLAITFMHGSRRRLAEKLGKEVGSGIPVLCETIDSFCLRIVNRYRQFLERSKPVAITQWDEDWTEDEYNWRANFTTIRAAAVFLLKIENIRNAVASAYPIILVDEFQDCHDDLLRVIQLLSQSCTLLVGADDFQCFHTTGESPAVKWIHNSSSDCKELTGNQRTENRTVLEAALAIRNNENATSSIDVVPLPPGLVAWHIFTQIAWYNHTGAKSHVLISPAGPEASPWVRDIMRSLRNELGKKKKLGPMPFTWEEKDKDKYEEVLSIVESMSGNSEQITNEKLRLFVDHPNTVLRLAANRSLRLISIRGIQAIPKSTFHQLVELAAHSISAFRCEQSSARLAMTVHGAKNREFDHVFILWPFKVRSDSLGKRKLLYNAITRAKLGATLFVQGDEKRVRNDEVLCLLECGLKASSTTTKSTK